MTEFVGKFNTFSQNQYAFPPSKGTGLLKEVFADELYSTFEHNQVAYMLFVDASKAFDTVCHHILIDKLYKMGFCGPFIRLLKSFLSACWQIVSIDGVHNSLIALNAGVPQVSVISPLLFNLYANDLSS